MAELTKLHREGTSVLVVTHDSKVAAGCDRVLYLLDGRIRGELMLDQPLGIKSREAEVNQWLREMGW